MADSVPSLVTPFRGERYAATDRLSKRLSPPYDVLGPAERARYAALSAHNIVHLILPEGSDADRYANAARLLQEWRRSRALIRDEEPSVYVVQQEFRTPDGKVHFRTGVIGALHVEPYDAGRVKPHETTHAGPKADRLALSRATEAMLESIFVLTRDDAGDLLRQLHEACRHDPLGVAELDGTAVGLWHVAGAAAERIAAAAAAGPVYLADGHHRYETANAYREENPAAERLPALIVPIRDPGLIVLPTHRLIRGGRVGAAALAAVEQHARETHAIANPAFTLPLLAELGEEGPACAVMLGDGTRRAYLFDRSDEEAGIAQIEAHVVTPLREAAGAKGGIGYTARGEDALEAVRSGDAAAAVLVNATPVEEVLAVSDRGGVMPPKSTYFLPKVPSGLVLMDYRAG